MASKTFRQELEARTRRVSRHFCTSGKIGSGTYGVVYKVRRLETPGDNAPPCCLRTDGDDQLASADRVYALKGMPTFQSRADGFTHAAIRELSLLREMRHENVIMVREVFLNAVDRELWLLFDYAQYDLWWLTQHHLKLVQEPPNTRPIPECTQKSIIWQLLNGIHYLHSNWILHRDLKPGNIFITSKEDGGRVKIGDMGLARLFYSPPKSLFDVDAIVVTYWYRAPELLLGARHYTKAIDLWSTGCIMAELFHLRPLFYISGEETHADQQFNKKQVEKVLEIMGVPTPAKADDRSAARSADKWVGLADLPRYKDMLQLKVNSPPDKRLARIMAKESQPKQQLLANLLRMDPQQRFSAKQALESKYFQERPLPAMNVFEGNPRRYPERETVDEVSRTGNDSRGFVFTGPRCPPITKAAAAAASERPGSGGAAAAGANAARRDARQAHPLANDSSAPATKRPR